MNIDYAAIISKANERKDALLRFESVVLNLRSEIDPDREPDLIVVARAFQKAVSDLDEEARRMLPFHKLQPINQFVNNLLSTWDFVDKLSGSALSSQLTPRAALQELAGS